MLLSVASSNLTFPPIAISRRWRPCGVALEVVPGYQSYPTSNGAEPGARAEPRSQNFLRKNRRAAMDFGKLEPSHVLRRPQQTCFARFLLLTLGILSFGSLIDKLPEYFQAEQQLEKTFLNHRKNLEAREMLVMENAEIVKHENLFHIIKMNRQHQAILEVEETAILA